MTNRKLEIDISHPCLFQNVLQPNFIDWTMERNSKLLAQKLKVELTEYTLNGIDNQVLRDNMGYLNILSYKENVDVIIIRNNLDWTIPFSKNKRLKKTIAELGY